MKKVTLLSLALILAISSISFADLAVIDTSFGGNGNGFMKQFEHQEAAPFKGLVEFTVTNTSNEAWGDFHFEIYDPSGTTDISNVHFIDSTMTSFDGVLGSDPAYVAFQGTVNVENRTSYLTWDIDNDSVGAKMDLYFYDAPIMPNETVTLTVMTDNTQDQIAYFGLQAYPTPVPEPATLALLGLGGLLLRKTRK